MRRVCPKRIAETKERLSGGAGSGVCLLRKRKDFSLWVMVGSLAEVTGEGRGTSESLEQMRR